MRLKSLHITLIAGLCTLLLVMVILIIHREYNPAWKAYQERFYRQRKDITHKKIGIRQIWLEDLGIADRCMTCHIGIDRKGSSRMPQPLRSHPSDYIKIHPPERFGCVLCHDGQAEALDADDAHGGIYSGRPVLKGRFAEALCTRCHPMPQDLPPDTTLRGAETLSRGWRLFNEYNCTACHRLTGYKRPKHIAPALTKIGSKARRDWLFRWLKNPEDYIADTKMPRYRFKDKDIADIASYLLELRDREFEGPLDFDPDDRGLRKKGRLLLESLGCLGCHRIGRKGVSFGPDLSGIGDKIRPAWLYRFLKDTGAYDPETLMPDLRLSEDEIQPVTAYLLNLKKHYRDRERVDIPGDKERGRRLIRDYGCLGCHEIEGMRFRYIAPPLDGIGDKRVYELAFGRIKGVERSLLVWLRIKVREPGRFSTERMTMRMPGFGFNRDEADALVTFLLGQRKGHINERYVKPLLEPDDISQRGRRVIKEHNCLGCHRIRDRGGEIGPDLTEEAERVRPEWLFRFLKRPYKIRPEHILRAGMPDFRLSDSDVNTIIEYFAYLSGERYPYILEKKKVVYPEDILDGEKLYMEIFSCIACHRINGRGGVIGPDHTDLASRLRRGWIEKWVKDPTSIRKDVRMPVFRFEDWQFEAIVDYLMTLGRYRFVEEKS